MRRSIVGAGTLAAVLFLACAALATSLARDGNAALRETSTVCPVVVPGQQATIVGTEDPETLTGTPGRDVIVGLGGDDTIRGLGEHDRICGGDGNDTIYGGDIYDATLGGDGDDVLIDGDGADSPSGGRVMTPSVRVPGPM